MAIPMYVCVLWRRVGSIGYAYDIASTNQHKARYVPRPCPRPATKTKGNNRRGKKKEGVVHAAVAGDNDGAWIQHRGLPLPRSLLLLVLPPPRWCDDWGQRGLVTPTVGAAGNDAAAETAVAAAAMTATAAVAPRAMVRRRRRLRWLLGVLVLVAGDSDADASGRGCMDPRDLLCRVVGWKDGSGQ